MNREEQIKMWQNAINEKVEPKSKPAEKTYDIGSGKPEKPKPDYIHRPNPRDMMDSVRKPKPKPDVGDVMRTYKK
jgi:hypothetical protein